MLVVMLKVRDAKSKGLHRNVIGLATTEYVIPSAFNHLALQKNATLERYSLVHATVGKAYFKC